MHELGCVVTVGFFLGAALTEAFLALRHWTPVPLVWAGTSIAAALFPLRELHAISVNGNGAGYALGLAFIIGVAALWRAGWKATR